MKNRNEQVIIMMVLIMIGGIIYYCNGWMKCELVYGRQTSVIAAYEEIGIRPMSTYYDLLDEATERYNEKERIRLEEIRLAEEELLRLEQEALLAAENAVNIQYVTPYMDVFEPTNLSNDDLYTALGNTRSGLHDVVPAVVDAEETYGVNAMYLLATIGLESSWGSVESGWNNVAGWKSLDGSWRDFESRYDCIMTVAEGLSSSFQPDVGNTLEGVTWRYCKDPGYLDLVMQIIDELQNNL